jgi:hypothetical protein
LAEIPLVKGESVDPGFWVNIEVQFEYHTISANSKFCFTAMLITSILLCCFSIQLSSMARDMCVNVRIEAFAALGKMQRVSEGVLLQSLSKKVIKTDTMSGCIINGQKLPPKLIIPCAAGIFAHGIEDEFYQVQSFLFYNDFP